MSHWSIRQLDDFDHQAVLPQRSFIRGTCNMDNRPLSPETCIFSPGNLNSSFEAGVSMPDLKPTHQLESSALQQYRSGSGHWLTSESPVARLNSFCSAHPPRDPHRLPSLPGYVPISTTEQASDSSTYQGAILADPPTFKGSVPQHPCHLHLSDVSNRHVEAQPAVTWQQTAVPMGDVYYRSPYSLSDEQLSFSPYSTPGYYEDEYDSPISSPALSSPELDGHGTEVARHRDHRWMPRSAPKDEEYLEDVLSSGAKPYAQLIQECLLQAPGHRMMLRDIYDWFERNTTKPRESGGNGWQNSIRHNLSMNKVGSRLHQDERYSYIDRLSRMTRPRRRTPRVSPRKPPASGLSLSMHFAMASNRQRDIERRTRTIHRTEDQHIIATWTGRDKALVAKVVRRRAKQRNCGVWKQQPGRLVSLRTILTPSIL
jgi:hypothetical protein